MGRWKLGDGQRARPSMAYIDQHFSPVAAVLISLSAVAPTRRKPKLYGFPSDHIFFWDNLWSNIYKPDDVSSKHLYWHGEHLRDSTGRDWTLRPLKEYIYISLYICIITYLYIYIYLETQVILLEVEPVPNNSRSQPGHSFSPESACLTQLCIGVETELLHSHLLCCLIFPYRPGCPGGANCWRGAQDKSLIRNVQSEICTSGAQEAQLKGDFRRTVVFPSIPFNPGVQLPISLIAIDR